jgi:drug/metabolite transporter (DMT)-like permease
MRFVVPRPAGQHRKDRPLLRRVDPQALQAALPWLALGGAILSISLATFFIRWADAPGPVSTTYRMGLAMLYQLPFFLARARKEPIRAAQNRPVFPVLAGLAMGVCLVLWSEAVWLTRVANASLLANSAPIFVALFAWLGLRQRLPAPFWIGLGLSLAGMALIIGADFLTQPALNQGNLLALASALFYGIYYLLVAHSRRYMPTLTAIWLINLSASLLLAIYCLAAGLSLVGYTPHTWLMFGLNALIPQVIGYSCATYALGRLPAWIVSPTMILQPALTALLAIPLMGETLTPLQIIGGAAALVGVLLINRHKSRTEAT